MRRNRAGRSRLCAGLAVSVALMTPSLGRAQFSDPAAVSVSSAFSIPQAKMIQPEALNKILQAGGAGKLVVLQVGSRVMFQQAHIRGARYAGPGSQPAGLELLVNAVAGLPKNTLIVIYCGCCPWNRCPNVGPAFNRLKDLGFVNVKVLYLADNFGEDWVNKGYSVETGS